MAIEHYKFIPDWPPEKSSDSVKGSGLYQPLADLVKKMEFLTLVIVARCAMLLAAVQRLGEEEVRRFEPSLKRM
jgi:hypothetical protein